MRLLRLAAYLMVFQACTVTTTAPVAEPSPVQRPVQMILPSMLPPGPALAQGYEYWLEPCDRMPILQWQLENAGYTSVRGFRALDDPTVCVLLVRGTPLEP